MTTTAELNRRLENILRFGVIEILDHDAKMLRVRTAGILTNWLPWPADIGRNYRRWRPLREGTQVVIGSASGDLNKAVILQVLHTQAIDAPSTVKEIDLIEFDDGTTLEYDTGAHQLRAALATTSLTANRAAITIASNGSTIVIDGNGVSINGLRVDLN